MHLELIRRYQNTSALMQPNTLSIFGNVLLNKKPYLLWKKNYKLIQASGNTGVVFRVFLMLTSNTTKQVPISFAFSDLILMQKCTKPFDDVCSG